MAIGINDLDDDDFGMGFEPTVEEDPIQQETDPVTEPTLEDDDYISDYLRTKGIDNINEILFEDEEGNIQNRSWNDLTKEEKINILNTPLPQEEIQQPYDNNNLSEEEIQLLNQIRQSNMTPSEFINQFLQLESGPTYKVDDLSDDEIYLLDLESRIGELSDEEAAEALNNAKLNEDFYKKQVEGIRKEYKEREDFNAQQEQASIEQEQQEAFERFQNTIIDSINNFNSVGDLDLNFEDKDKEELASFILSQDEQGVNYLYQALQDPETLTKAAWFILNGEEAFNDISEYFKKLIKLVSENQYKKGLEDGKKGILSRPTVLIDNSKTNNNHRTYLSIDDLDD